MAAYAELPDIVSRWRPLTSDEQPRAQVLLEQASRLVRLRVPAVDARILAGTLEPELVADVVVAMVVRVLAAGVAGGTAAVTQKSVTVGNITTSTSFSSGSSSVLTLEPYELSWLMPTAVGSCFTVSLAGPDAPY